MQREYTVQVKMALDPKIPIDCTAHPMHMSVVRLVNEQATQPSSEYDIPLTTHHLDYTELRTMLHGAVNRLTAVTLAHKSKRRLINVIMCTEKEN